ncbi:MAG: TolC family protein [Holophagales bacterium]|nr:TolC family protein [Holophagales bacterium]
MIFDPRAIRSPSELTARRPRPGLSIGAIVRALVTISVIALGGCASVARDTRAEAEKVIFDLPSTWAAATDVGPVTTRLLDLVDDDRLRELVVEALEANRDLRVAAHRLAASRRLLAETRAPRSPFVTGGYSAGRGNQGLDELGRPRAHTNHRVALDVSWEIDVWRRLADLHDANGALTQSQAADVAAARDALGARVMQAWVTAAALRQAIAIEEERVQILERLQETITRRYRRGIGSLDDLAAARSGTELARANVAGLEGELDETQRALEVLVGRTPRGELESAETLPVVARMGAGLPATAIARRHDVAAALWRLQAADASAAAAAKALLPSLRLTGELFEDAPALSGLSSVATLWNVIGSLTQPIFRRGLLKARADARRLELEAAWEAYRAVVLRAVGEVEDALGRERSLARQRDHLGTALRESVRNRDVFEGRYRAGLASILELLQAEDRRMDIHRQILALDGEISSNRITLALAVGAGFEEVER